MAYLKENIDAAIVCTQFDLRGFWHPLGFRCKLPLEGKDLSYIPVNLIGFAVGFGKKENNVATDESYCSPFDEKTTKESVDKMCKKFAQDCDLFRREAIQLIIKDILKAFHECRDRIAKGEEETKYIPEVLDNNTNWGMLMVSLVEAFEVDSELLKK